MDYDSSTKFISSLAKFLQSLCNGYVEFDNGVEVIGHIYLSVDTGKKIDYILNEKVCKTDENSVTFISNSFHAQPAEKPKPASKKGRGEQASDSVVEIENDNESLSQAEPRSTNSGTIPRNLNRNLDSPSQRHGKRPFSPHSRPGSSPASKRNKNESHEHGFGTISDEGNSSIPSPAADPLRTLSSIPTDSNYSQSYDQSFNPADNSSIAGDTEDIKPSIDTDVTFVKEEFTPSSCSLEDERNQGGDPSYSSIYQSNQSYSGGGGPSNQSFNQQNSRLSYGGAGERSEMFDPAMTSSHMEGNDTGADPSVANRMILRLNIPEAHDAHEDLAVSLCKISGPSPMAINEELEGRRRSRWADRAKRFSCQYCWKTFVVRRDWEGHVNSVHLKIKPFVCELCNWSSSHKGELQKHQKRCQRFYQGDSAHLPGVKPKVVSEH